jgi:predicted dehydrogenase/nucleoside-diphosphate-sugar epimerase
VNFNPEQDVRIGVIGCGAIAELFHLPALVANPATKNAIALADPNETRLNTIGKQFSAAVLVQDYRNLVGKVDGVVIATPPASHHAIAKFFLEQGIHVLSEKPLTESYAEARDLVEVAEKSGAALAVNQTRRFYPTWTKIRELIADGTLGDLESITYHDGVEFSWPAASSFHFQPEAKGAWSDVGVHLLDSILFWIDATPALVESRSDSLGGPEAMCTVELEHQGCRIEIKVSRLGRLMNGFEIIGSKATIKAETGDWDEITVQYREGRKQTLKVASRKLTYNDFAKPMLQNFVECIRGKAMPFVSGKSTLGTIELLEQAYDSAKPYRMHWNEELTDWCTAGPIGHSIESRPRRILVTGAAGFVGGRLVEILAETKFAEPVAAIRKWSRAARSATRPIQIVTVDLLDRRSLDAAMQDVDAVVHCAFDDGREAIVDATRNVLEAAAAKQVKKFVYLSSAEVYGPQNSETVTEGMASTAPENSYGGFKCQAERLCGEFHAKGLKPTILRPSIIYGPFGKSWSNKVAKRLVSGRWSLFDDLGDGIANMVYVDDLVQAILLSLVDPKAEGETFNVNGPDRCTWNGYFQKVNTSLGLPPLKKVSATKSQWRTKMMGPVRSVTSYFKAKFEDRLMEIYLRKGWMSTCMKMLKGKLDTTPTEGELNDLYGRKALYDDLKIRKMLGYKPQFDLDAGVDMTTRWFARHEISPRSLGDRSSDFEIAPTQAIATASTTGAV